MASLTDLLLATVQDPSRRAEAEAQIKQAELANPEQYFTALAQELAGVDKPTIARQLAGLLLKNALAAKDPNRDRELKKRWTDIPAASRNLVKEATTSALIATEIDVGKAAAQVLAKIGAIEVPVGEWDGLVPLLLQHVTNTDPRARQVSLITLGYLCEELVVLQEEGNKIDDAVSNSILTAVVQGMRDNEITTKLEATHAFYHAVVLAQRNFRTEHERNFIMQVLIELCKCQGAEQVQIAAFECLVQIATEYYDFLLPYMNAIGPLTWDTIKMSSEKVAIPAMEFWSTVCDEELYLQDLVEAGQAGDRRNLQIINQALQQLVPLLTQTMTKRESEEDDDTWNLAMAAGTCLALVAQVTGDACVPLVLEFVSANFGNQDWRYREAAILAYGSIMEGPSTDTMRPIVQNSLSSFAGALDDRSVAVRDTFAWTLGRIAQYHPTIVPVKLLGERLAQQLQDVPGVAANICWVIQVIAESQPGTGNPASAPATTEISEYFTLFASALLQASARPDATEKNLRMSAYNALSVLVAHTGDDCMVHMERLTQEMHTHMTQIQQSGLDRECELQGYICGVLTSLTQRLRERIAPYADRTMEECLKVIAAYQQAKASQSIPEEALLLACALATAVGSNFEKYMPHFAPQLRVGLQNHEDVQVCLLATAFVGDICRALGYKVITYCDNILQILYTNLQNTAVDRRIKASIMPCFGDIALAVEGDFEKYLAPVVQMLAMASTTTMSEGNGSEEWFEYLNSLREGVLQAYTGIIHGLKGANKIILFKDHVQVVLQLVELITKDKQLKDDSVSEDVMRAAVGVVGDLIIVFKQELTQYLGQAPFVKSLIDFALRCEDPKSREAAMWMQQLLQRYRGGVN